MPDEPDILTSEDVYLAAWAIRWYLAAYRPNEIPSRRFRQLVEKLDRIHRAMIVPVPPKV